ncbi:MAG: hypothetical protein ACFFEV_05645 [Candidatus Thorarchaeota archaeon]
MQISEKLAVVGMAIVGIALFIGGLIVTFNLVYIIGNPVTMYVDQTTPPSAIPGIIAEHGLDQPIYIQFFYYLGELVSGTWVGPPESLAIAWWTITAIQLGGLLLFVISLMYYLLKVRKTE